MSDAAPDPVRLRIAMTRAIWPIVIIAPVAPVVATALARLPGSGVAADGLLAALLGMQGVLLLGALAGARLLELAWAQRGLRLASRPESWALLAVAVGGALLTFGAAAVIGPLAMIAGQCLIYGMFGMLVAVTALIVLGVRSLRGSRGQDPTPDRMDGP